MKNYILNSLMMISLSIFTLSANAQLGDKAKKFKEFGQDAWGVLSDLYENYTSCRAMGFSDEQCQRAATICATFNFATGKAPGIVGQVFRELKLFETFKPRCGDGTCFQCCYASGGCHTSFIGFPVINCNYNYGADARAAGITLVLGGEPGDACLFTPQTCEHIPICHSGRTQQQIDNINNDPDHIIKAINATEQRLLNYGKDLLEDQIYEFLNDFSTGDRLFQKVASSNYNDSYKTASNPNDTILIDDLTLADFYNLISSRGNPHWGAWIDSLSILSLNQEAFGIYDTLTNELLTGPSKLNFIRQITLARTLASVPNLIERLNFTGSYIWTDSTLADYMTNIIDPDELLESQMNPLAVHFIKNNTKHQDYRLLAVPLQDEGDLSNFYGGYDVGQPPVLQTTWTALANNEIELDMALFSPGTHQPPYVFDGTVYWGDGTVTHFTLNDLLDTQLLKHTYPAQGNYQAFTVVQNSSGLRCFKMDAINISTNATPNVSSLPVVNELTLSDVNISTGRFTFTSQIGLKMSIGKNNAKVLAGQIGARTYNNLGNENFGEVSVHNYSLIEADTIYIEPLFVDDDESGAFSWLTFGSLQGYFYNAATDEDMLIDLPIDINNMVFYDTEGNRRTEELAFIQDDTGKWGVYLEFEDFNMSRIAIPIDQNTLSNNYIPPQTTPATDNHTYLEMKPNLFETYLLPDCSQEVSDLSIATVVSFADVIQTNTSVDADESVALIATDTIKLLSDFCTKLGGEFHARIGVCMPAINPSKSPVVGSANHIESQFKTPDKVIDNATSFYFNLPKNQMEVSIKLLNLTGTLQKTMIDKQLYPKGQHQFHFTKGNLSAGVYQLVFEVDGIVVKTEVFKLL